MRVRTIITTIITGFAVMLVLSFKTPELTHHPRTTQIVRHEASGTIGRVLHTRRPSAHPSAIARSAGASPATQPPRVTPTPSSIKPTKAPSPKPTRGRYMNGSYDGTTSDTQYGPVQVRVIVSGGRITDVQALQMPSSHQRSQEISQEAGPKLRHEVLQAQSANIDTVSGATYTSEGYRHSVQSALDQAR